MQSRKMQMVTAVLVLTLAGSSGLASATPTQEEAASQSSQSSQENPKTPSADQQPDAGAVPDSPGAAAAQQGAHQGDASSQSAQQAPAQKPAGTAAAEPVNPTGVAASEPAGAAIAPAKQRRTRSLLIKLGVVVGAGVALGTVYALSAGTPSKPPGSH
jgi:hypothetical protein